MPEENIIVSIGGSVERAVKGEYSINVKAILTEAWQHTLQSRMSINIGLLLVTVFGMIVSFIASSFFGGIERVIEDPQSLQLINVIVTIAVWPFMAGIEMMGVFHAVSKPTKINMVLSFLHRGSWVALCALLTSLLISLGFQLLIIPGVLLAVLLSLTIPLVVEKNLTPVQAIALSVKALRFKIMPLLAIYSVLFLALISLAFPIALLIESSLAPLAVMVFLFGLSYLAPWYYNIKGVLYREIFGVYSEQKTTDTALSHSANKDSDHNGSDDTFSA
ncbi:MULTISPECIES: hypothetical protein [Colwellia]|uniref:Putative membrane protein n=1 Tax=Colwellia psychrerythraea (strain 34H / ATCC BAA-681) TaxID=167879 RepID=Q47ZU3_COLP3|nr:MULTISPECIES: hypothetical protein [Colwellia]AAZ28415.1 putative membrane protein [Colwellia psychrerythraea 34H]PKH87315.1 hypothetical protein CXF79_11585 [Colwellia sp. Bg11-28]